MRINLQTTVILAAFMAFSSIAQESNPATKSPEPPSKQKLSYALGMNLGLELKRNGVEPNSDVVSQAIKDVLNGKATEIQESEIRSILKEAETTGRFKLTSRNIAAGEAFLAKNAKAEGVKVLPDGLQYRVIQEGAGELPKKIQIVVLRFRGHWIDGTEFQHNDSLEIPLWGCPKGVQEALLLMKVGSKWEIFVPYNLAYGHVGERATGFGSTLIYDLELVSAEAENAHPNQHHGAGRVGHTLDEDLLPPKVGEPMDRMP